MSRERDTYDKHIIQAFRANGGVPQAGLDLLLLHHVGARSGRERVTTPSVSAAVNGTSREIPVVVLDLRTPRLDA
jgi:hypothetical protein